MKFTPNPSFIFQNGKNQIYNSKENKFILTCSGCGLPHPRCHPFETSLNRIRYTKFFNHLFRHAVATVNLNITTFANPAKRTQILTKPKTLNIH